MSIAGLEAIADPRFSDDVARYVLVGFKLLSQMANEDSQVLGLFHAVWTPHSSEQGTMGDDLSRVARKVQEQIEFLRR